MSENSSVNCSIGSIIHIDGDIGSEGLREGLIAQLLQFEDIYLTESEDFWQEQQLDGDKRLFEESVTLNLTPKLSNIRPVDDVVMIDASSSSTGMCKDSVRVDENVMIDGHASFSSVSVDEQIHDVVMMDDFNSLTDMYMDDVQADEFALNDQACLTGDQRKITEIDHERPIYVIGLHDPSMYVVDTPIEKPAISPAMIVNRYVQPEGSGSVLNETSSTSEIGSMQSSSSIQNFPRDMRMLQDELVVVKSIKANPRHSCDNRKMFVRCSTDKVTKKLCCPYCKKLFSKLARHLATMHKKEQDVKKFVNLPKGSKDRRFIQDSLRKAGSNIWNSDADLNKNELIPSRRPSGNSVQEAIRWTTCPFCIGSYTKNNLRHHIAECPANFQKSVKDQRILTKLATIIEKRIHDNASTRLVTVMGFMREDEIVRLVRFDWLLIVFGNKMCCKYTPHYQENMIRARLRLTGRVLTEMKKLDSNVTDFASIYHVERYNALVSAIRNIARFDSQTSEFGAPAMASFAVTFIRVIGKYLSAEYIRLRDRDNKIETEDFLTYMDTDIDISINKLVAETQAKMRRLKQQNIPTMDDVKKLLHYINSERNICFRELSENFTYEMWLKLAEMIMAWIIVFNRRRIGEVQNILVDEFLGRECINDASNEQMLATLSSDAKMVAEKFKRMKIRGKKGRTVPTLLKPSIDKGIQLLIDNRQMAGLTDNQYLFELPSSTNLRTRVIDACQLLRKLSVSCGAINPSSLRGTNLRKHMATTCVSLELNDALVAEVADFMGHAEKIHREYYRQNTIDREVVQMAELLEKASGQCDEFSDDEEDEVGNGGFINVAKNLADIANSGTTNERTEVSDDADDVMIDDIQLGLSMEIGTGKVDVGKKKCTRIPWSKEEISCVEKVFAVHFKKDTLPVETEIENQRAVNPILQSRSWQQIKAFVNNKKKKLARK